MTERYRRPVDGPIVEAVGVTRDYSSGGGPVHALRGVDLRIARGELLVVRGRSGSGKTTLLNLLGGLDRPTAGRVILDGREISGLAEDALVDVRRKTIAFIFQAFDRHLFYDIYVVQQIKLSTGSPLPGYELWPQRRFETMLEYQNDADVLIRISRLER